MVERLRDELPDDVVLIVTGDHGMVDVPRRNQILAEDEPELMAGVDALAGEGRFRQLYVDRDHPSAVAARWADRLGDLAWVRTRDEAIDEGWFGPVDPELRRALGSRAGGHADRLGGDDPAVPPRAVPGRHARLADRRPR